MSEEVESSITHMEFERLLNYIKHTRGFDFTGYKQTSLMRRIIKRMQMVGVELYNDYTDYLEVHPEEFIHLFNTILINVTSFFRDPKAWEYIASYAIPRIAAQKGSTEPIRVWSAGCASGEEAYTIAILLAENLGIDQFKERVKIYATDLDEEALTKAREANYTEKEMEGLPPDFVTKYFERNGAVYNFSKELRRYVIFGRHDLMQDAPISRVDLLVCRNILMYFNAEAQSRILARLNYALNDNGFLFLGRAEMLLTHDNLFTPIDLKNRIFAKVITGNMRERLLVMSQHNNDDSRNVTFGHVKIPEAAFNAGPVAQIAVDNNGYLFMVNEKAQSTLGLSQKDLGRPFQDLEISYRPVELRSSIEQVYSTGKAVKLKEIEMPVGAGDIHYMDIELTPLKVNQNRILGTSISFLDVTEHRRLEIQLEQTNQELEAAMEELQSTNEELETTNEELQSTIEELETTNEELQSTNEELETMNEELQSTNEELETINDELSQRTSDLNQVNTFLECILTSLRGGVIVVDTDMKIQIWNRKSEDLWGLRSDEVQGRNLFGLDIGLPVEQLKRPIRSILNKDTKSIEVDMSGINRRGRNINVAVTCTPLEYDSQFNKNNRAIQGVIIVIEQNSISPE